MLSGRCAGATTFKLENLDIVVERPEPVESERLLIIPSVADFQW